MKENRPEQAGIGLSMLRVAFRSRQASHRLLRIRFASMTQFDGMSSEHHPLVIFMILFRLRQTFSGSRMSAFIRAGLCIIAFLALNF
ncbi:hypothetical protein [Ralstonia pseudosolanacearum]|nr:hypothetical protein [Ralstonia sp. RS647]UZF35273.1 hypothetical protein LGV81_00865 [Ralstonia sp. RS647]